MDCGTIKELKECQAHPCALCCTHLLETTAEQGCAEGVVVKSSTTGNQQCHILFEIAIMPLDTKYALGLTTA